MVSTTTDRQRLSLCSSSGRPLHREPRRHPQHVVQHQDGPQDLLLPDPVQRPVVGQRHAAHLDHGAEAGVFGKTQPVSPQTNNEEAGGATAVSTAVMARWQTKQSYEPAL